ncbi:MAG: response regulator [Deltaproteobacteria bacterium]|nr:response regulator [Deltaproteobacteria bacterium]
MKHRLLFVDDEENILKALCRLFHREGHELLTAKGGEEALALLESGPVSLIISDQRMPGMSGAEFLTRASRLQPEAVRIMLTGYSELQAAVQAINEGQVYRFLPKPWNDTALLEIVGEALAAVELKHEHAALQEQVRRQNEELKELNASLERKVLERTNEIWMALKLSEELNGTLRQQNVATVKAFAGMIELRSPAVGAHCRRVAGLVPGVCSRVGLGEKQAVQDVVVAALLHDLGKIVLPDVTLVKEPSHLSQFELGELRKHPVLGQGHMQVLESFADVGRMIRHHHENVDGSGYPDGLRGDEIPLGARVLRVLDAYDNVSKGRAVPGLSVDRPLAVLETQVARSLDAAVFSALLEYLQARRDVHDPALEMKVPVEQLREGMVLSRDLRTESGVLLVAAGEVLKPSYIEKIRNLRQIYETSGQAFVYRSAPASGAV